MGPSAIDIHLIFVLVEYEEKIFSSRTCDIMRKSLDNLQRSEKCFFCGKAQNLVYMYFNDNVILI